MTDKEKILAKIEILFNETNYEPFTDEVLGRIKSLKELKSYIDSLQEESVFKVGDTIQKKDNNSIRYSIINKTSDGYRALRGLSDTILIWFSEQDQWELVEEPVSKVWHYQKKEPVNEIADKSRPIIVVYGNNSLNAAGKFKYYEDNSDAIWLSNSYEKWAFVEDLINLTHSITKVSWQEEFVSEDLEEASKKYSSCIYLEEVLSDDDKEVLKERLINTFKAGADWQKEQDIKILKSIITNGKDYRTLDSFLNTFKMMQYGKIKM